MTTTPLLEGICLVNPIVAFDKGAMQRLWLLLQRLLWLFAIFVITARRKCGIFAVLSLARKLLY